MTKNHHFITVPLCLISPTMKNLPQQYQEHNSVSTNTFPHTHPAEDLLSKMALWKWSEQNQVSICDTVFSCRQCSPLNRSGLLVCIQTLHKKILHGTNMVNVYHSGIWGLGLGFLLPDIGIGICPYKIQYRLGTLTILCRDSFHYTGM